MKVSKQRFLLISIEVIATNLDAEIYQKIDTKYDDRVEDTGEIRGSAACTSETDLANFG